MDLKRERRLQLYIRLLENQLEVVRERIDLLKQLFGNVENRKVAYAAGTTVVDSFRLCLFESVIMALSRTTDTSPNSKATRTKKAKREKVRKNLTVDALINLVADFDDQEFSKELRKEFQDIQKTMKPIRTRRNKILGHSDTSTVVQPPEMWSDKDKIEGKVTIDLLDKSFIKITGLINKIRGKYWDHGYHYSNFIESKVRKFLKSIKANKSSYSTQGSGASLRA